MTNGVRSAREHGPRRVSVRRQSSLARTNKGEVLKASSSEQLAPVHQAAGSMITKVAAAVGRVLVIDDEAAVGRTIQRLLGEQYEVVVLTAGSDAIDLLVGEGAEFDLILCDLTMPDVTGMDVFTRIVQARADIS